MSLNGRIDPARLAGPGAAVGYALRWDGFRFKPEPVEGPAEYKSLIEVWSGSGSETVLYLAAPDPAFELYAVDLKGEFTMPAGSSIYVHMYSNNPTLRALYEVDGAVFGYGGIKKVRDAAGAVVSGANWNLGDRTWRTALNDSQWEGTAANTADFTMTTGFTIGLVLGGTYRLSLGMYPP